MKNIKVYYKLNSNLFFLVMLLLMAFPIGIFAQKPITVAALNGFYTQFDTQLPKSFYYQLERKEKNKTEWENVFTGMFPGSSNTFKNNLIKANAKNALFTLPADSVIEEIYAQAFLLSSIDSLWGHNANTQIIEALGLGFFDVNVKPQTQYQYRVTQIDSIGNKIIEYKTNPKPFPSPQPDIKTTFIEYHTLEDNLFLKFSLSGKSIPYDIAVFRQVYLQSKFYLIETSKSYFYSNDSLFVLVQDKTTTPDQIYQYFITPFDVVGNNAINSDTIRIQQQTQNKGLPQVLKIEANANEEEGGIELTWELSSTNNVSTISIYRSTEFNSNYNILTRTLPSDLKFIDKTIQPGINYYYYIVVHNKSNKTPPTAIVSALYKGKRKAVSPPQKITLKSDSTGNYLTWLKADFDTKGYYIHRGIGHQPALKLLSNFINNTNDTITYFDPAENLKPGLVYSYAITSENSSYSVSPYSNLIFSEPLKPELPTPTNLYINRHGDGAFLVWDNLNERSPFVNGYKVLRSVLAPKEKVCLPQIINPKPLPYSVNTFLDTTIERGISYSYQIQAIGVAASESALSLSFEFSLPELLPIPPAGIRITNTNTGGVLYWDSPGADDIKAYKIYLSTAENKQAIELTTVSSTTNEFEFKEKSSGTYFFSVSTLNNNNIESQRSDEVWIYIE